MKLKIVLYAILIILPYCLIAILLLSMATRIAVFEWLSYQINLASIVSMITLATVVGFRIDIFKVKKKFEDRVNVVEKKLGSVQKDVNDANRSVRILAEKTARNEGEIEILKSFISK